MVGYNDKMRTLLETVIDKIAEFEVRVDRFSVIKVVDNSSLQICMFFGVSFSPFVDMPRTSNRARVGNGYTFKYTIQKSNSTLRIFCSSMACFINGKCNKISGCDWIHVQQCAILLCISTLFYCLQSDIGTKSNICSLNIHC